MSLKGPSGVSSELVYYLDLEHIVFLVNSAIRMYISLLNIRFMSQTNCTNHISIVFLENTYAEKERMFKRNE